MDMEIKFTLGKTVHQQPVLLVAKPQANGTYLYDLVKQAVGQQDDTVVVFNLTDDTLEAIAQAHAKMKELQA